MSDTLTSKSVDRRSFLRGSAIFAAALGIAVVPAFAQQQPQPEPKDKEKDKDKDKDKKPPKDPFDTGDESRGDKKKLVDKEGREYRICPQCGYNMYREGRMWVCENCGYSYIE